MKTTDKEFFRIVNYIRQKYGINFISKRNLVEKRLEKFLLDYNYDNYDNFMDYVENNDDKINNLFISSLVTNHTFFLREKLHFELLNQVILPNIYKRNKKAKKIKIWSAATSSGQEAYSLIMVIMDFLKEEADKWDIKITGTDISEKMLNKAILGEYTKKEIESVKPDWKKKYFTTKISGDYKINDKIKSKVVFEKLNLIENFNFNEKFQIIFLRNVLIYFECGIVNQVVDKVIDYLEEGGYLFIGLTETIDIKSSKLLFVQPSVYRKI